MFKGELIVPLIVECSEMLWSQRGLFFVKSSTKSTNMHCHVFSSLNFVIEIDPFLKKNLGGAKTYSI